MLEMTIENIMCDHPIKVKDNIRVGSVAHLLLRHQINGILVVEEKDENKLVGILTTTDLLRLINEALGQRRQRIKALKRIANMKVGQVATREIISLSSKDTVMKALAVMHRKNIHTIPIYNKNKLVGVIGKHDILNIALI